MIRRAMAGNPRNDGPRTTNVLMILASFHVALCADATVDAVAIRAMFDYIYFHSLVFA